MVKTLQQDIGKKQSTRGDQKPKDDKTRPASQQGSRWYAWSKLIVAGKHTLKMISYEATVKSLQVNSLYFYLLSPELNYTHRFRNLEKIMWACTNNPTAPAAYVTEKLYMHAKLA